MRVALVMLAACGGDSFTPGASITLDGTPIVFAGVSAAHTDTFFELTATSPEGTLAIAFPDDTAPGAHTCDESRVAGLITVDFTTELGIKLATYFPTTTPADDCSFELVSTGTDLELADLTATLVSADGTDMLALTAGELRARVTP